METALSEENSLGMALVPVDLNDGANTGLRISMAGVKRMSFVLAMGASTAAAVNISLKQHDAASAGNTKALSIGNPYYKRVSSDAKFTKVVPGSATDNYVLSTDYASLGGLVVFDILAEDLDVEGGFGWVSLSLIDSTAAKLGAVLAIANRIDFSPGYDQVFP